MKDMYKWELKEKSSDVSSRLSYTSLQAADPKTGPLTHTQLMSPEETRIVMLTHKIVTNNKWLLF